MNPNNADRQSWNEWMVFYCPDCIKGKENTAVPSSSGLKPFRYHMWLRHLSSPEHQNIVNRKYGSYYRMTRYTSMDEDRYVMTFALSNAMTERDLCDLCDEIAYYGVLTELVYLKGPAFCIFTLQASGHGRQGKSIDRALSIVQKFKEFRQKPIRIFQKTLIKAEDWRRIFNKWELTRELLSAQGYLKDKSESKSQKECSSRQGKSEYQKDMQPEPTSCLVPFQAKDSCHENSRTARNNNAAKSYNNKEDEKENVIVDCSLEMSSRDNETQPSRKEHCKGKSEKGREQTPSSEEASPQAQQKKADDGINSGACENQNNVNGGRGGIRPSSFSMSTKGRERRNKRTGAVDLSKLGPSSTSAFSNGIEDQQTESVAPSIGASGEKQDEVVTESPPPPNEEGNEKQDEVETAASPPPMEASGERDEIKTEAPSNYPSAVSLCSSSSFNVDFCKSSDTGLLADVPQEIQPEMSAAVVQDEEPPDGAVSDVNTLSSTSDEAARTVRNSVLEDRDERSSGDDDEEEGPDYLEYALYWRRFKD